MKALKKCAVAIMLTVLSASPCFADGCDLMKDIFYGGVSGGLIGTAVLLFTQKPTAHLQYIGYGAAGGVAVGAVYGTVRGMHSLAEVENGKVRFSIPTVIPDILEKDSKGKTPIVVVAQLLAGKF